MTFDHFLDSLRDTHSLFRIAECLSRAEVPDDVLPAIRFGRLTASRKANAGRRKGHCGRRCPETHFEAETPKIKPPLRISSVLERDA